jgi:3-hydroxyacyl-[acyl-carrier-protein] dehydratase
VSRPVTPDLLPHTVPFLFVDRVLFIDDDGARVLRCVTRNDALLRGAAPLPAALVVEALAQAAGLLIKRIDPTVEAGALTGIDGFVFHGTVRHGDRVVLEVKLRRIHAPFYVVAARALVDGESLAEGRITLSTEQPWLRST